MIEIWLLSYWRYLLAVIVSLAAFGYVYHLGYSHADEKWELEIAQAREKARASGDEHSIDYETEHAEDRAKLASLKEELAHAKNPDLGSCYFGAGFVREYDAAAGR